MAFNSKLYELFIFNSRAKLIYGFDLREIKELSEA